MEFFVTLKSVYSLFILILAGFIIRKFNIVDGNFTKPLSNFLFYVSLPAMIISSMDFPFSPELLADSLCLVVFGTGVMGASVLLSCFFSKILSPDYASRNVYEFSMIFSNFAFMGLPVAGAIFGKKGIFLTSVYTIPIYLIVNTYGIMLMQRDSRGWKGIKPGNIINPSIVAALIGFMLFAFSLKFPEFIASPLNMLGSTTTPLSMVLACMLLAGVGLKDMFGNYRVYLVVFIRLLGLPLLVLIILRMFVSDPLLVGVPVINTAMPVAANVSILSEKFGGNSRLGSQCVFISTFLSIATIPVIAWLV